jgi:hypothetical protein
MPIVFLYVGGRPAHDLVSRLTSFSYSKTIKKTAETRMTFRTDGDPVDVWGLSIDLASDPRFQSNAVWQFRYGYLHALSPIITGIIRQVEPSYGEGRSVSIQLLDKSTMMAKSSSNKNWGRIPSSKIAQQIADKYSIGSQVVDSKDLPKKAFIQPGQVLDLQFLRDLAGEINYECFIEDDPPTLVYRPVPYDDPPEDGKIVYRGNPGQFSFVKSFKPSIKSLGPISDGSGKAGLKKKKEKNQKQDKADRDFRRFYTTQKGVTGYDAGYEKSYYVNVNTGDRIVATYDEHRSLVSSRPGSVIGHGNRMIKKVTTLDQGKLKAMHARNKPAPVGANTSAVAGTRRTQMLDKSQGAKSEHPLTAKLKVGSWYVWDGLDKPFNKRWYCSGINSQISASGASTSVTWKRDDPTKKKQTKKKKTPGKVANETPKLTLWTQAGDVIPHGVLTQKQPRRNPPITATKPQPFFSSDRHTERSTRFAGGK